jgi:hypothetical protein
MSESRRRGLCAASVFLVLLGVYLLTNSGRIDSIDGQYRWEVSKNLLDIGEPSIQDPRLHFWAHQDGNTGKWYVNYNAGASVTPIPLMLISRAFPGDVGYERDRFVFALTGGFFGAALGAVLVLAFGLLGLGVSASVAWALVFGLATMWWPSSVTVLDQNQHALFAFGSLILAWQSGRRKSYGLAALAGLTGGLLLAFQESYALILPMIAIAVFASPDEAAPDREPSLRRPLERSAFLRYATYGVCSATGLLLFFGYNYLRYSAIVRPNRYSYESGTASAAITWGDPFAAIVSLLASPGKGFFFFSPPLILAVFGALGLFKRAPVLLVAVVATSLAHLGLVSQLAFFSGDWCWGPRYLVVLLPMWTLTLPFAAKYLSRPRFVVGLLVSLGLLVQVMAVTFDYHRFFFERNLGTFFYVNNQWVYFQESQLIARPFEIYSTLREGIPSEAVFFAPTGTKSVTYTTGGSPDNIEPRVWVRLFKIWYVPWPWPLWIWMVEPDARPINPWILIIPCVAMVVGGAVSLVRLTRGRESSFAEEPATAIPT